MKNLNNIYISGTSITAFEEVTVTSAEPSHLEKGLTEEEVY